MSGVQRDIKETHALKIDFEDRYIRAQPLSHPCRIDARGSASEYHHPPGQDSRYTTQQDATATEMLRQEIATDEDGHAACNLAHRLEERQSPVDFDRFVS